MSTLCLQHYDSPVGSLILAAAEDGALCALTFGEEDYARRVLAAHHPRHEVKSSPVSPGIIQALDAYFAGDVGAIDALPTRTGGTSFQRDVWNALRTIPPGAPVSYGWIAAAIGRPDACRAVGAANGANPVAVVVPCHRVIGSNGSLTGFGGGLDRKLWLLQHEERHAGSQRQLAL